MLISQVMAPPYFGISVNPISTRGGGQIMPHITTGTPEFSVLLTALLSNLIREPTFICEIVFVLLIFLKMCPIFIGSVHNFGKR